MKNCFSLGSQFDTIFCNNFIEAVGKMSEFGATTFKNYLFPVVFMCVRIQGKIRFQFYYLQNSQENV